MPNGKGFLVRLSKAILISGDKDFLPAAEMVIRDAGKDVAVVFPYHQLDRLLG